MSGRSMPATASAWGRKLTAAGFAFFFAKGMLWLALGATLWQHGT
ncbi:MAG: hypothetical protein AAF184_01050 [Pseudomonadota bacterium]